MSYITNLNVRSNYSFLASNISLEQYINFAKTNQLTTLVLTDKNVMYGAHEFYHLCLENHIKPVIGLDCQWKHYDDIIDLTLISTNYQGYQILIKIASLINTTNPILTDDLIKEYCVNTRDLVTIINAEPLAPVIVQGLFHILNPSGKDLTYIGVGPQKVQSVETFKKLTTNVVAMPLITYLMPTDAQYYQVLQAIKEQKALKPETLVKTGKQYYWTQSEMAKNFPPETLDNIVKLLNMCHLELPKLSNNAKIKQLPVFPCPKQQTSANYLKQLCKEGLENRFNSKFVAEKYIKRLLYELEVINFMEFNDYFLIVHDYVQFAKTNNILVGPGRGSVAGSLAAYVLGISDVDPIKYDLIFERFLNPERTSLPDIDIDFQDERREEIIQYLAQKYGLDHVAHIVTFQTIASKMALRDLGRVFNVSIDEINEMTKLVPLQYNFDLDQAIKQSAKLSIYAKKYQLLFTLAKKIIGFPRQTSTHAAGIVLSQKPLTDLVPIQTGFNNIYQTQYPMNDLENIGLIKMDILGLRNLTILQNILEKVKTYYHQTLTLANLPLNDEPTFTILRNGDTTGIFQLESPGMRQILQDMETNDLEDIIATSSLFRPGPQEYIKTYIKRKLGQEKVKYLHPDLEPYLKSTYGIIVYQEQILLILQKIAGYSLAKADLIRRAISKKDSAEMQDQENSFLASAQAQGYPSNIVKKIWADIKQFAGYGFNRSHAVAYSLIGYWLAYLKANYPLAFMSCLLTSVIGNDQKLMQYLHECQKYDIKVLPPSINQSQLEFAINMSENALVYALPAIKQMSLASCSSLINDRTLHGPFQDLFDFCARAIFVGLNRRNCEYLIAAGALDEINPNRTLLLGNLENALKYANIVQTKDQATNVLNVNLVSNKPAIIEFANNWETNSINEYKALGLYLKYNPEARWKQQLDPKNKALSLDQIAKHLNQSVLVLGRINSVKTIKTKKDQLMAFATLQNNNTIVEVTIFDKMYQKYQDSIQVNKVILMYARVNEYQDKVKLILEKVVTTI